MRGGNADVRRQIVEALARDPIEDANPDRFGWVPRYGNIDPPDQPRRRTRRRLDLLLEDLASDKVYARRVAASALGGWKGEPAAIDALRAALRHDDPWTRGFAARSLGHLGDLAPTTWDQVLTLARQPVAAAEVGAAIVLLAELDPATRRTEADSVLARMAANSPASTRELRAYRDRVAAMT